MKYTLSIDWLSVFGRFEQKTSESLVVYKELPQSDIYAYKKQPYGTRQFAHLWFVYKNNTKVAEVQSVPHSVSIMPEGSCIVKFDNAILYSNSAQLIVEEFLQLHYLNVQRISRIDICADFQKFHTYEVVPFVRDFMAMQLRHIGRGDGAAYFEHKSHTDEHKCSKYYMHYTGLAFGSHSSDIRVYLYNKTKELAEQGDKPYIRDMWTALGFGDYSNEWLTNVMKHGMAPVWRLEVSIKGDGIRFKDKETDTDIELKIPDIWDKDFLTKVYFTFISCYFQFVRNRPNIRNITREPRIDLFGGDNPTFVRRVPRNTSAGDRSERIAIRKLWQLTEEIRPMDNAIDKTRTQSLAHDLAQSTDLAQWLMEKIPTWEHKTYKR